MNGRVVWAILKKDLWAFSRDRLWMTLTVIGIAFYVIVYWLLPDTVDESLKLGLHAPGLEDVLGTALAGAPEQGLAVTTFSTEEALASALEAGDGDLVAGLAIPEGFIADVRAGARPVVTLYVPGEAPAEVRDAIGGFASELAFAIAGTPPPADVPGLTEVVVGRDRAGDQVTLRESFRPIFVFFALMIEVFALAALVAGEISRRTVVALLVTPARLVDFLAAKTILGTLLAFAEAVLLMALLDVLGVGTGPLLVTLLLGSVLVTGIGLLAGSSGKDFLGIIFYAMAFVLPLAVPAFAVLFPGTAAAWVRMLPTYGLVNAIVGITTEGAGFGDIAGDLAALVVWCFVSLAIGLLVLRRKVATL